MKGQYLTVEYIAFFAIGIGMIVAVYYMFSDFNARYEKSTTEYQLKMLGEMVSGMAMNVLEVSNSTNSTIYYNLSIPTKLSRCVYSMAIANDFLMISCIERPGSNVNLTLYNFNITTKNNIYSTSGLVSMIAKNGWVELK
jgi:predicted molibdopterin-dependent oxidoreductase YjgC